MFPLLEVQNLTEIEVALFKYICSQPFSSKRTPMIRGGSLAKSNWNIMSQCTGQDQTSDIQEVYVIATVLRLE